MNKIKLGAQVLAYPMPAFLVGANVDGKPNLTTVAWGGIANGEPPMVAIALRHSRHTNKGIRQNRTFSVNIPSANLVKETDYCGIISGLKANKLDDCKFTVFYGKLETAPLIEQCPVNLECQMVQMLDLGSHDLIVGRIEETYIAEECLTDGKPDVNKINPLCFIMGTPSHYHNALGDILGQAFSIGKEIKNKE
jgi:flavin reductase (DIM6/NTAB) family NADH-FMN oxidoreductase RutF